MTPSADARSVNSVDAGLPGTASDAVPAILATGDSGASTLFLSMAERHPQGADADYLRWHSLDHRPEQHRLPSLRASLRMVSTPACRAARAAADPAFDAIDHVMSYFFADAAGLAEFAALSKALSGAGRVPFVLTPVQRGVYTIERRLAADAAKAGADVLPWRPTLGIYLLLEALQEPAPVDPSPLIEVAGVAGLWSGCSQPTAVSSAGAGQLLTYCFLDDDPVATAARLAPVLQARWAATGAKPLLAAPFHTVVPFQWDRYLP